MFWKTMESDSGAERAQRDQESFIGEDISDVPQRERRCRTECNENKATYPFLADPTAESVIIHFGDKSKQSGE
jgi:hypothetical protein